jgi:peptidoglycan/xylan/chitin deacetylase (PgdA/CDA1 family)
VRRPRALPVIRLAAAVVRRRFVELRVDVAFVPERLVALDADQHLPSGVDRVAVEQPGDEGPPPDAGPRVDDGGAMPRSLLFPAILMALVLSLVTFAPAGAAEAGIVRAVPRSSGAVALTFDDGWNVRACARIADILRERNVSGTFFVNGRELKQRPATWRRILEGMPVGNHTRTHKNLVRQSGEVIRRQIETNERIHERILGRPMLKLFRPPYGSHDRRVRRIAGELGYRYTVMWNVQPHDWSSRTTAGQIIQRATGARPGSIILLHCRHASTVRALPKIIRHYKQRDIGLVGLDELLGR